MSFSPLPLHLISLYPDTVRPVNLNAHLDIRNVYKLLTGKPQRKRSQFLEKQGMRLWSGFNWLRVGSSGWSL
jgi:hypothetical protein